LRSIRSPVSSPNFGSFCRERLRLSLAVERDLKTSPRCLVAAGRTYPNAISRMCELASLQPLSTMNYRNLERIPVTWKRSLHVGSNWRTLAD
jgi:hypothetical protein